MLDECHHLSIPIASLEVNKNMTAYGECCRVEFTEVDAIDMRRAIERSKLIPSFFKYRPFEMPKPLVSTCQIVTPFPLAVFIVNP